jgi:hypothetical protein
MAKKVKKDEALALPEMGQVTTAADKDVAEARQALEFIGGLGVTNDAELQTAISMTAEVKEKHGQVGQTVAYFTDPAKKWIDLVRGAWKPALDSLLQAEKLLKGKVSTHVQEREAKRDELLVQGGKGDQQALAEADALITPKVDGLSLRESWKTQVTDPAALVAWCVAESQLQFVVPNEKVLKAHVKALGRDPQIPGLLAKRDVSVAVTVDKVKRA